MVITLRDVTLCCQPLMLLKCMLLLGGVLWCLSTEWPPIGKIAAHSAYDMFLWYKYLIVNLVFSILVFGVGIFF